MTARLEFVFARILLGLLCVALFAASLYWQRPEWRAACLPLLVAMVLLPPLMARQGQAWIKLGVMCALIVVSLRWPLFGRVVPALICIVIAAFFAITLRPGSTPLIERMAQIIETADDYASTAALRDYRRRWTAIWALWMLVLAIGLFALAWRWPGPVELLAAGLVIPAGVLGLLAFEYRLRRRRFTDMPHRGFPSFLAALANLRLDQLYRCHPHR
jgi:hypothetical protein